MLTMRNEINKNEDPSLYVLKQGMQPFIDKNFPRNSMKLLRSIADYRDQNIQILSSPYLYTYPVFPESRKKALYQYTGLTPEIVDGLRKQVASPEKMVAKGQSLYTHKANFTSEGCILVLLMNYYYRNGQEKYLEPMFRYLGYYMYYAIFLNQFGKYKPNRAVMDYTINNLANSFILKKKGNLDDMILHGISGVYSAHPEYIQDAADVGVWMFLDAAKSRVNGYLREISAAYFKNHKDGNKIYSDMSNTNAEGELLPDETTIGTTTALASAATANFFNNQPNAKVIHTVAECYKVSESEIKTAINKLKIDNNVKDVSDFYTAIFYLYLSNFPEGEKEIGSTKFVAQMDQIYRKGNSKNENILLIKSLTDKWLKDTSATYRASNREGTINAFRKSIFFYFVFVLSNNL